MALAWRALVVAARHADDMDDELTPLEADRLVALFSREPFAKEMAGVREVVRAIDRLARANEKRSDTEMEAALADAARVDPELAILHERARDILAGRFEPHEPSSTSLHPQWMALLDAVVAMRDEAWPRAANALRRLAELAERGQRLPPHVWTTAQAALGSVDAEVRAVAGRLVAAMMKTTTAAPPRGWLGLAQVLAVVGMDELSTTARRSAAVAKEPGATDALALTLTRSGWQLALAGERSPAIERLREAKALSPAPAPAAPPGDDGSREPPAPPAPPRDPASNPST
jgi:predicted transcriptional regulator